MGIVNVNTVDAPWFDTSRQAFDAEAVAVGHCGEGNEPFVIPFAARFGWLQPPPQTPSRRARAPRSRHTHAVADR